MASSSPDLGAIGQEATFLRPGRKLEQCKVVRILFEIRASLPGWSKLLRPPVQLAQLDTVKSMY